MIEVKKNNFLLNEEVDSCLNNIIKSKSFANGYIFYDSTLAFQGYGRNINLEIIKNI